jgi:hypothetical protein
LRKHEILTNNNSSTYAFWLILTLYSLIPTPAARQTHAAKRAEKRAEKEKWANSPTDNEMTAEEQWQHMWELQQLPRTPGTVGGMKSPMTPRTRTFNELEGGGGFHELESQRQVQEMHGGAAAGGYMQPTQGGHYSTLQPTQGGYYGAPGAVPVQQASPPEEHGEFISYDASKGKGHAVGSGAGAAY